MKYLVLLAFVAILGSLGSALFFMMRDGRDGRPKTSNMARALAFAWGFPSYCSFASCWPGNSAISSRPGYPWANSRG